MKNETRANHHTAVKMRQKVGGMYVEWKTPYFAQHTHTNFILYDEIILFFARLVFILYTTLNKYQFYFCFRWWEQSGGAECGREKVYENVANSIKNDMQF